MTQHSDTSLANMSVEQKRNLLSRLMARKAAWERRLPLSFAEERLWYLDALEPGNRAYVMSAAAQFSGQFDASAFARAVNDTVRRHESLRTFYLTGENGPVRAIASTLTVEVPVIDLRQLEPGEQQRAILSHALDDSLLGFSLSELPLFRILLLRLDENVHVSLAAIHHIIFDHWSTQIFHREVMARYAALCSRQECRLPELPIQLSDFATWQRKTLRGDVLQSHLDYWRTKLSGIPNLDLPTDHPRPSIKTYAAASFSRKLTAGLAEDLARRSSQHGVTLFMTLLACFKILLHYYSRQDDIVVGIDVAGRTRSEAEPLIGFFVNELPLRTDLSGNPQFEEMLARVRQTCLEAYSHQDAPFHQIVKLLPRARDLSRAPVFQIKLALARPAIPESALPDLSVQPLELVPPATELDLTLFLEDTREGFIATIQYNRDLFDRSTIALLMCRLEMVLDAVARGSHQRLDKFIEQLSLTTTNAKSQVRTFLSSRPHAISGSRKAVSISGESALHVSG